MTGGRDEDALLLLDQAANDDQLARMCALGFHRSEMVTLRVKLAFWFYPAWWLVCLAARVGLPFTWCSPLAAFIVANAVSVTVR